MLNNAKSNENDSENDASSTTTNESRSQTSSKPRRSRKLKRGRKTVPAPYKFTSSLIETPALQIFAVAFNHFVKNRDIFATASGNKISIYECVNADDPKPVQLLRVYIEPDKDEVFNCVCWSYENNCGKNSVPLLAAGGVKGVVRVIQIQSNREPTTGYKNFIGHTGAINDMKFHPIHPHLLLSGSKDYSIRLWNIRKSTCIAIFSGIRGHRDEVLSIDVSADGSRLISGGIDHNIMVWNLNEDDLKGKIELCKGVGGNNENFKAIRVHFPEFSTRDVHGNYVDTVKYFGNTFLSKSCENNIVWWTRKEEALSKGPQKVEKLFTFDIIDSEIWFMRMEIDLQMSQMAVGSKNGKVFVFDLNTDSPVNRRSTLQHSRCTAAVRQMSFSKSGNVLVAVCDDGSVWRWDRKEPKTEF